MLGMLPAAPALLLLCRQSSHRPRCCVRALQEDDLLRTLIHQHGPKNWSEIANNINGRSGKSCRLRWCNQLNPDVKKEPFSDWEDAVIIRSHEVHGNKWASEL